jgi:hypothetical protein
MVVSVDATFGQDRLRLLEIVAPSLALGAVEIGALGDAGGRMGIGGRDDDDPPSFPARVTARSSTAVRSFRAVVAHDDLHLSVPAVDV